MKAIAAFITVIAAISMIILLMHPSGMEVDPPKFEIPKVQIVSQP